MGCAVKCFLLMAIVAVLVAYRYNHHVPGEFQSPWKMKLLFGFYDFVLDVSKVVSLFTGRIPIKIRTDIFTRLQPPQQMPGIQIKDDVYDGIPVRVFTPEGKEKGSQPAVVYVHGGGWTYATVDLYHNLILDMASFSGVRFIAVDYRQAPEFIFPAPYEDCMKATTYVLQNAAKLHVDPKRVAIMGDSSGANVAAAVALGLRNHPLPLKLQVIVYPPLQPVDLTTPSYQQHREDYLMLSIPDMCMYYQYHATGEPTADKIATMMQQRHVSPKNKQTYVNKYMPYSKLPAEWVPKNYKPHESSAESTDDSSVLSDVMLDERYSPLLAKDLTGIAKTLLYSANYDIVRDENYWYVLRLRAAGVDVVHFHEQASFHGLLNHYNLLPEGQGMMDGLMEFIKKNL